MCVQTGFKFNSLNNSDLGELRYFVVYDMVYHPLILFFRYDVNNDHYLDLMEMKFLMEKLDAPQTHVGLKAMIAEIDEDNDGKVSFREVSFVESCHLYCVKSGDSGLNGPG